VSVSRQPPPRVFIAGCVRLGLALFVLDNLSIV
jgi:hypothetical protein